MPLVRFIGIYPLLLLSSCRAIAMDLFIYILLFNSSTLYIVLLVMLFAGCLLLAVVVFLRSFTPAAPDARQRVLKDGQSKLFKLISRGVISVGGSAV